MNLHSSSSPARSTGSGSDKYDAPMGAPNPPQTFLLSKDEEQEWGGWERVEALLRQLHQGHPGQPAVQQQFPPTQMQGEYQPQRHASQSSQQLGPTPTGLLFPQQPQQGLPFPQPMHQSSTSPLPRGMLHTPGNSASTATTTSSGTMSRISIQDII